MWFLVHSGLQSFVDVNSLHFCAWVLLSSHFLCPADACICRVFYSDSVIGVWDYMLHLLSYCWDCIYSWNFAFWQTLLLPGMHSLWWYVGHRVSFYKNHMTMQSSFRREIHPCESLMCIYLNGLLHWLSFSKDRESKQETSFALSCMQEKMLDTS